MTSRSYAERFVSGSAGIGQRLSRLCISAMAAPRRHSGTVRPTCGRTVFPITQLSTTTAAGVTAVVVVLEPTAAEETAQSATGIASVMAAITVAAMTVAAVLAAAVAALRRTAGRSRSAARRSGRSRTGRGSRSRTRRSGGSRTRRGRRTARRSRSAARRSRRAAALLAAGLVATMVATEQAGVGRIHVGATDQQRRSQSKPFHTLFLLVDVDSREEREELRMCFPAGVAGDSHESSRLTGNFG